MNAAFKVETLHASFDNPHHVLVVGMAAYACRTNRACSTSGRLVPSAGKNRVHSGAAVVVGFIAAQPSRVSRARLGR